MLTQHSLHFKKIHTVNGCGFVKGRDAQNEKLTLGTSYLTEKNT